MKPRPSRGVHWTPDRLARFAGHLKKVDVGRKGTALQHQALHHQVENSERLGDLICRTRHLEELWDSRPRVQNNLCWLFVRSPRGPAKTRSKIVSVSTPKTRPIRIRHLPELCSRVPGSHTVSMEKHQKTTRMKPQIWSEPIQLGT